MTDPEVLFDRLFVKLRKQIDKNIEQQKELSRKYSMYLSQWDALCKRKQEVSNTL